MMRPTIIGFCLALAVCLHSTCLAQLVIPQTLETAQVTLPQPDPSGLTKFQGLNATIEVGRQFGVGYAQVNIDVKSTTGVLGATRRLQLRLTPNGQHLPSDGAVAAVIPFEFAQGSNRVQVTKMIPKWTLGNQYLVELAEDNVVLEDHVAEVGTAFSESDARSPERVLSREIQHDLMFLDTRPFPGAVANTVWLNESIGSVPADWRAIRDVNTIVVPFDKLLAAKDTPASESLRHWAMAGGTLVVLDAPDASEVGRAFGVSLVQSEDALKRLRGIRYTIGQNTKQMLDNYERLLVTLEEGPQKPQAAAGGMTAPLPNNMGARFAPSPVEEREQIEQSIELLRVQQGALKDRWKKVMPYRVGAGFLLSLPTEDLRSPGALRTLEELSMHRNSATVQRGVDPVLGDVRYQRWLIPGVAQPPVYGFMGALTLFVILVGPVAYRFTAKAQRSHLMFIIAPTLALLTTVAMFSYSVVSDGFGTTTRIRQVMWIDGSSGDAFERTRATLFSGIAPRGGIVFPADAEVMLYRAGNQRDWSNLPREIKDVRFRATVTEESQRFSGSVLPSRAQRQFVSHLIRPRLGGIAVKDAPVFDSGADAPPTGDATIVSNLPFDLEQLIVRSDDGRYWFAARAPGNSEFSAVWLSDLADASKRLGDLYNMHRMIAATAATRSGSSSSRRKVTDLLVFINRQISRQNTPVTDGNLERLLNQVLFADQELPLGSFVALGQPTEDAVAVEGAEVVSSVRYVMGTLQ